MHPWTPNIQETGPKLKNTGIVLYIFVTIMHGKHPIKTFEEKNRLYKVNIACLAQPGLFVNQISKTRNSNPVVTSTVRYVDMASYTCACISLYVIGC